MRRTDPFIHPTSSLIFPCPLSLNSAHQKNVTSIATTVAEDLKPSFDKSNRTDVCKLEVTTHRFKIQMKNFCYVGIIIGMSIMVLRGNNS